MGLFSKKKKNHCYRCGKEVGFFSSRPLANDLYICDDCANLASHLYKNEILSIDITKEEFEQYLAYNEENLKQLNDFSIKCYAFNRIAIDESCAKFAFDSHLFMPTVDDLIKNHAEVFSMTDIRGVFEIITKSDVKEKAFGKPDVILSKTILLVLDNKYYPYLSFDYESHNSAKKTGLFGSDYVYESSEDLEGVALLLDAAMTYGPQIPVTLGDKHKFKVSDDELAVYDDYFKMLAALPSKYWKIKNSVLESVIPNTIARTAIKKKYGLK